ncbi:unnamed protein product [Cylindrotheca closterium]|uniref:Uncharacterized protein n=1 Tax=Cylindrotheca closterium TaxID=2856 RepID=A0AAD2G497_9STRA|nr:unnamed protein product [Cylindrotheca closterium]
MVSKRAISTQNVRRAKSQEGPRADSRHGTDPQRRSFLSARSLDERRSGRSAGSNISRTVETFPFFSPEAAAGEIAFCKFKASCRRSCGGVMELEGKADRRSLWSVPLHDDLMGRMLARLVGNDGFMGHKVVNRFGRRQACRLSDVRQNRNPTLSTWKTRVGRMCDAPRAKKGQERTVAMELTHRGGLSSAQEAWTKEGAVAALDPTSAAPWRPFRFSRPRRQLERLLFANSRPVVVGRVGE